MTYSDTMGYTGARHLFISAQGETYQRKMAVRKNSMAIQKRTF